MLDFSDEEASGLSKPLRPQQVMTPADSDLGDSEGEDDRARGGGSYFSEAETWVEEGYLSERDNEVKVGRQIQKIESEELQ